MQIKVLISEEQLRTRIKDMAEELNQRYQGEPLHIIGILKGSVFFMCELAKYLTMPVTMDFMKVSSYGDQTESSGQLKIDLNLGECIEGKHVCVVEDIVDTGRTLACLKKMLLDQKPASLILCTMLDKPDKRVELVTVDYTGFTVPDYFVVGFGLDYAQKYRNLPYIGVIEE